MADITKCLGAGCKVANECYRHTAPDNPFRQSYFTVTPKEDGYSCDHFIQDDRNKEVHE